MIEKGTDKRLLYVIYSFDGAGIVYFISVVAICLFLTMQSIQKRRWN